ncbi:TRAP transporter substrate-binding protein [Thermodesulfobacteriota bacterium]
MKKSKRVSLVVLGVILGLALILSAYSQPVSAKPITLRYGLSFAQSHPFGTASVAWMKKIEKDSGGQVKIERYWSGALVNPRQSYIELCKGVADIADYTGSYVKEGFHIEKAMRLLFYGVPVNSELAYRVYDELRAKYPQIDKEFSGGKVLAKFSHSAYDLLTKNKPVRKAGDFKGLTVKTSGAFAHFINGLGGEGARVPMSETYMALRKGTIDGALATYESLKSWKFAEVVKYYTLLDMSTWPSGHVSMNLDTWNKLPQDIKKVFDDNISYYNQITAEELAKDDKAGLELGKKMGVEFIKLSQGDFMKIYKVVETVVLKEAKRIDGMGLPGTAIYKDARSLISKYR